MCQGFEGLGPLFRMEDQQILYQVDGTFGDGLPFVFDRPEHCCPLQRLYLWESELCIIVVHCEDFLLRRSSQNFYYLNQLINTRASLEEWCAQKQLRYDTTQRPHVN